MRKPTSGSTGYWRLLVRACVLVAATFAGAVPAGAAGRATMAAAPPLRTGTELVASNGMVVSTSGPRAIEAGAEILREGGSAADAAMATALAQVCYAAGSWVSYQGVISMLAYDASTGFVVDMNGVWNTVQGEDDPMGIPGIDRSTITRERLDEVMRTPPSGRTALVGGFMKGVEAAHEKFGRVPFARLFEPAIRCAEDGWTWTEESAARYASRRNVLQRLPETRAVFTRPGGGDYRVGDTFRQPALAKTLRAVAKHGADYMHTGTWARRFVQAVRAEGGKMSMKDLADYRIAWNQPISTTYGGNQVYAAGEGLMGGYAIISGLNLLEAAGFRDLPFYADSPQALHDFAQAIKPGLYGVRFGPKALENVGTKLGIDLRTASFVRKDTAAQLWEALRSGAFASATSTSAPPANPVHSDSIVAIDRYGNVAAVVHSINTINWGNTGIFVDGISIADAAFYQRNIIAQVARGARLPVAASPGLVLRDGRAVLGFSAIGTGLVPRSVAAVASVIDRGLTPRQAIDAPSIGDFTFEAGAFRALSVVPGAFPPAALEAVERMGQRVVEAPENAGYWVAIQRDPESGELRGAVEKIKPVVGHAAGY